MRTLLAVCLDESGSMDDGGKRAAAISAFNEYLASQKKLTTDDCLFTLTKFNTTATQVIGLTPIAHIAPLTTQTYMPNGGTALFDAIAQTISGIDHFQQHTLCEHCHQPNDRIILVILSDGEENSSRHHTLHQIKDLVRAKEATNRWTFVYLSAGLDAFAQGARLGMHALNTYVVPDTAKGVTISIGAAAAATRIYRQSTATSSTNFFQNTAPAWPKDEEDPNVAKINPTASGSH